MEKPYYQSIVDALKSVKRPGLYAAGGEIFMPSPAISLAEEPDIVLGLPLSEVQAKHLIELASRAPFGRGEQTIIDTSVRCTWQLNPSLFSIINPKWEKKLQLTQHSGIWLLLDKQKPHDAHTASACLTDQTTANFPQELSHNLLTISHQRGMEQGRS